MFAVRLDYFGKLSEGDQKRIIKANPQANKKAPVFYVGQTTLLAWQRPGPTGEFRPIGCSR